MDFDLILLHNPSLNQELRHVLALIALKLNYLPQFFVLDDVTITTELLLHVFEDLLVAEILLQTLDCCQALLAIPLLHADMNILFASWGIRILGVCEWIVSGWDLDVYFNHQPCLDQTRTPTIWNTS